MYPMFLYATGTELYLELGIYNVTVSPINTISATVNISGGGEAVSFGYEVKPINSNFTNSFTYSNSDSFVISSLTAGESYKIQVRGHSGSSGAGSYGEARYTEFTMPKTSSDSGIVEKKDTSSDSKPTSYKTDKNIYYNYYTSMWVDDPSKIVPYVSNVQSSSSGLDTTKLSNASNGSAGNTDSTKPKVDVASLKKELDKSTRSFLKLSNSNPDTDLYTVSLKSFPNLNTAGNYYVFGTALFFDPSITNTLQGGGLGFFVDALGKDGYYIDIRSTALSAPNNSKEFTIYKIKGGKKYPLEDSQSGGTTKVLNGVYGGQMYKIDVKVKVSSGQVDIVAYVNGFKITATDKTPTSQQIKNGAVDILPITNKIGLRCQIGTIYFDYVYALNLNAEQFAKEELFNQYKGQFSNAFISFLYGNTLLENQTLSNSGGTMEEFGPVAREIKYLNTRYESAPAFPLYTSVGANPFAQVLGERLSSFNAKVYVVNNTGTTIPLDDGSSYSLFIVGKYINVSSTIEYFDNYASEFDIQEPVQFESTWIQKQSDVNALATWIKNVWSKNNMIVNIEPFGNPLLSVGDIININYPYNDLYHTGPNARKFVVTKVSQKFDGGLQTSITARTL